jgi:hypothetical protein
MDVLCEKGRVPSAVLLILVRDILIGWRSSLLIAAVSVAQVFLQAASVGAVFLYVAALEQGSELSVFGATFKPDADLVELSIATLVTATLFIMSAAVAYVVRSVIVAKGLEYYKRCFTEGTRALVALSKSPDIDMTQVPMQVIRRTLVADARYCAAAYTQFTSGFLPLLTVLVAATALLYFSTTLMLIAIVGLGIFAPIYLRLFTHGHDVQVDMVEIARENAKDKANLASAVTNDLLRDWSDPKALSTWMEMGVTEEFLKRLGRRQKLTEVSGIISNFGIGLAMAGFVFYVGQLISQGGAVVASLASVIIVFRYLVTSFNSIINKVTNLHATLPLFGRLMALRELARRTGSAAETDEGQRPAADLSLLVSPSDPWIGFVFKAAKALYPDVAPGKIGTVTTELFPHRWDGDTDLTVGSWTLSDSYENTFPPNPARAAEYEALRETLKGGQIATDSYKGVSRALRLLLAIRGWADRAPHVLFFKESDFVLLNADEQRWLNELFPETAFCIVAMSLTAQNDNLDPQRIFVDSDAGFLPVPSGNFEEMKAFVADRLRSEVTGRSSVDTELLMQLEEGM